MPARRTERYEPSLFKSAGLGVRGHVAPRARAGGRQSRTGISGRSVPGGRAPKAADAVITGWNQYPPMMGLPELRQAVSAHYRRWQNLSLDPDSEIMVTSGATEAIAGALIALIKPGDEVIFFQPMYDAYVPLVQRAGASRVSSNSPRRSGDSTRRRSRAPSRRRPRSSYSTIRSIRRRPCSARGPRVARALLREVRRDRGV